jgi:prepilin-type N-terminal cleavage/methylation domain-containing protein
MDISNKKGFTLVETLVAITILMIAIAGPLTVATKAFTASLDARNQTIATSLAQETMEYLNNIKDNSGDFINLFPGNCPSDTDGNRCYVNSNLTIIPSNLTISQCSQGSQDLCGELYKDDSLGYNYSGTGSKTPFSRYYYITTFGGDPKQVLVNVVVKWNNGSVTNNVTLQSILTSQPK